MQRMIVGITGGSGIIYGIRLLEELKALAVETHLVVTPTGFLTLAYETQTSKNMLKELADVYYPCMDLSAPLASGSFKSMGMIVAPCSMKSLADIAHGNGGNLLTRAADVTLKERRRLVLMARETPLNLAHLQNMTNITLMGGIIFPPVPAFYDNPTSLAQMVDHTVGRVLDLFDLDSQLTQRWGG